jgi:hypothetical protein
MSRKEITAEMVTEFREMVRHKLLMWDASTRLEQLLDLEVDTSDLDDLCACLDDADGIGEMELREYLANYEETEDGDDLCDKCMRSGVQVARTDEDGNTICTECDEGEE